MVVEVVNDGLRLLQGSEHVKLASMTAAPAAGNALALRFNLAPYLAYEAADIVLLIPRVPLAKCLPLFSHRSGKGYGFVDNDVIGIMAGSQRTAALFKSFPAAAGTIGVLAYIHGGLFRHDFAIGI